MKNSNLCNLLFKLLQSCDLLEIFSFVYVRLQVHVWVVINLWIRISCNLIDQVNDCLSNLVTIQGTFHLLIMIKALAMFKSIFFPVKRSTCTGNELFLQMLLSKCKHWSSCKDIFACLFSIHNTINLSCHEQVCLSGLRFERCFSHHRRCFSHHWSSHWDISSSIYVTLETNLDHLDGLLKEMCSP